LKVQKSALEQAPESSEIALHTSCPRKEFQWPFGVHWQAAKANDETENASQQDGRIVLERFD